MTSILSGNAMQSIASQHQLVRPGARFGTLIVLVGLLAGCAGLVDKPVTRTLYDFGPDVPAATASAAQGSQAAVVLADIDAAGALDGTAVLYRLAYADANQLRPYAQARWSASPPQLVRQRLRELLGRERPVLDLDESAALAREGGVQPRVLRLELEEFSQVFESTTQSVGLLRLRATLMQNTPAGEKLVGQRTITMRAPAATADAPGGVRALGEATNAAAADLGRWLRETR